MASQVWPTGAVTSCMRWVLRAGGRRRRWFASLARRRAGHVATSVGNRVHQSFLAQYLDRPPRRRPRDLELLDDLALGRYARIRLIFTSANPPADDLRNLPVRRNWSDRVNPVSAPICHRGNCSCIRLMSDVLSRIDTTMCVCGQGDTGLGTLQGLAGSFGRPVRASVSRDPAGARSLPSGRLLPAPTCNERMNEDAAQRRFRRYRHQDD